MTSSAQPASPEFDEHTLESRAAAAEQLRRLHHSLVGHAVEPSTLDPIVQQLRSIADQLEQGSPRKRGPWTGRHEEDSPADGAAFALDFDRPMSGPGNPWSLPTPIYRDGNRAVTTVTLDAGYEGAPGRSHGGIVAAMYDDLAGYNLVIEAVLAFTGWIKIDYKAPTPLHEPITFATWVDSLEGRKMRIVGECRDAAGTLLSTCDSLFITISPTPEASPRV